MNSWYFEKKNSQELVTERVVHFNRTAMIHDSSPRRCLRSERRNSTSALNHVAVSQHASDDQMQVDMQLHPGNLLRLSGQFGTGVIRPTMLGLRNSGHCEGN